MKPSVDVTPDLQYCDDCRSCELACSFHHLGVYQPSRASIEINRDYATGKVKRTIFNVDTDGHIACDDCKGEPEKLCEKFCSISQIETVFAGRRRQGEERA